MAAARHSADICALNNISSQGHSGSMQSMLAGQCGHNVNGLAEQNHLMVKEKLRSSLLQRSSQARERGEQARPYHRADGRAEAQRLCALAQENDDRSGKKRAPGGPLAMPGDMRKFGGHGGSAGGVPMGSMPGASAHHLHAAAGHNRVPVCHGNGMVCPSTMDASGLPGLPASLCSTPSGMPGMMDDPYGMNTPLGSSAPAGSYSMNVQPQMQPSQGPAEWHAGLQQSHDPALRGMAPYQAGYHDSSAMSSMAMMQSSQLANGAGQLRHSDASAHLAAAQAELGHAARGLPAAGPSPAMAPANQLHLDAQLREQYMQQSGMSSVGTPTTPNPADGSGGLDGAYNWPSTAVRTSSAVSSHPSGDFPSYPSAQHMPQTSPAAMTQQHVHAQLRQQQQQQQQQQGQQQQAAGMMALPPIMDEIDQVFMENQWAGGNRDGQDPSLALSNLNSPLLSHDPTAAAPQVPNVSVVPTSYSGPYNNAAGNAMATHRQQSHPHQHPAGQPAYFPEGHGEIGHRHGSTGCGALSHAGATHNFGVGYQSTSPQAQLQQAQGVAGVVATAGTGAPHQQAHRPVSMPYSTNAYDAYNGSSAASPMMAQANPSVAQPQQPNSHFSFSSAPTSGFPGPGQHPGSYGNNPASNPASAGFMDNSPSSRQPTTSGMSLQQILQTPPAIPMPDRMPFQ